jgi:MoxR-like ATPase
MTMTPEQATWFAETFGRLADNVSKAVLGKTEVVRLALTTMLAEGHLLLEDAPGTGKTSLAKAIAATVKGTHNRIQFTPDLLPSDVTGITIYDQKAGKFEFHRGPVFASIVLADEINRASPKTQSALLEVMEESRVTVDGVGHEVGRPFLVIATQNPIEQAGTYLVAAERILAGVSDRNPSANLSAVITTTAVADMATLGASVHVDSAILRYVVQLAEDTRNAPETRLGVSVRGSMSLIRAAKVWAAAQGRHFVLPDDIKQLAAPVWLHRFVLDAEAEFAGATPEKILARVLADVAAPQSRQPAA